MFIIKLQTKDGYYVYGDVKEYHYEYLTPNINSETGEPLFLADLVIHNKEKITRSDSHSHVLLYLKKDWGNEPQRTILFNQVAYVCNEKGDTIEKLC